MARLFGHLDLVARGDLARLRRLCAVDDEDLADMIRELRGYDPKPGLRFGGEAMQAVVPDLFIARRPPGWAIEINAAIGRASCRERVCQYVSISVVAGS